jgi:hypothetical protein
MFHVLLRGGPELADGEIARLVDEEDPQVVIERRTADGRTARFRISGDYEVVDGDERRVYRFEDGGFKDGG